MAENGRDGVTLSSGSCGKGGRLNGTELNLRQGRQLKYRVCCTTRLPRGIQNSLLIIESTERGLA
ncbi:unnamed protein product [Meloidogyne enterolobii]|uniref:Uncharacterized protein n=1 Tax=Meloidogyne enterolobii TaxID=390850 RepID=A0ACB0XXT4_MELEN